MRARLFEKYYKRGLDHFMFKDVLGLSKPDKKIKRFYYVVIAAVVLVGTLLL